MEKEDTRQCGGDKWDDTEKPGQKAGLEDFRARLESSLWPKVSPGS